MDARQQTVTRILGRVAAGERGAVDELFPLVYDELRVLARNQRRRWQGDYTLNTTALVHEAYLKLADRTRLGASERAHFFALAARAMRHILSNYAKRRRTQKRGGGQPALSLDEAGERALGAAAVLDDERADVLAALDDALTRLERLSERQGRVVECRFYGGMSVPETAEALGISPATVKRDWALAQAWLLRELRAHAGPGA